MKRSTVMRVFSFALTMALVLSVLSVVSVTASAATSTGSSSDWQWPMRNAYCTWNSRSNWSWATYNNNSGDRDYHLGVDIYGSSNSVYAAASGKVVAVSESNSGANGRYVIIQHTLSSKTVYSFYAHLRTVNAYAGQTVNTNTKIGTAGGSGNGNDNYYGTHLHFAVVDTLWANGRYFGYAPYFTGDQVSYSGVTYYNPRYIINNDKLPSGSNTSGAVQKSNATAAQVESLIFNAKFYANTYGDLYNAFGYNATALKNHWKNYGIKEGRVASPFFDAKWYMATYPDVAAAYGATNWKGAYTHFINCGFNEGRQGSPYFSAVYYLNKYSDLKAAFGSNYLSAAQHFLNCGLKEGRQASSQFSIAVYSQYNSDVARAYSDPLLRISHYIRYVQYGRESRKCV